MRSDDARHSALPFHSCCLMAACLLSACSPSSRSTATATETPQSVMVRVAKQAQACWFAKKDPAFSRYKMATELNSFSGKPRILIVPKDNPQGLPKLVAQAERKTGGNQFSSFGPLLAGKDGKRLSASLRSWASGQTTC